MATGLLFAAHPMIFYSFMQEKVISVIRRKTQTQGFLGRGADVVVALLSMMWSRPEVRCRVI